MIEKRIRLSELGDSAGRIARDLGLSLQAEVPVVRRAYVGKGVEVEDDLIHAVVSSMRRPDLEGETVDLNFLDIDTVFRPNPVILWNHDSSRAPIARSEKTWIENEELHMRIRWAATPFAQEIGGLYKTKFLKSWSIGFISVAFDEKTKTHKPSILIETSSTPIGCNLDARVVANLKSADLRRDLNGHVKQSEREGVIEAVKQILLPHVAESVGKELLRQRVITNEVIRSTKLELLKKMGKVIPYDTEEDVDEQLDKFWPGTLPKKPDVIDRDVVKRITNDLIESMRKEKA